MNFSELRKMVESMRDCEYTPREVRDHFRKVGLAYPAIAATFLGVWPALNAVVNTSYNLFRCFLGEDCAKSATYSIIPLAAGLMAFGVHNLIIGPLYREAVLRRHIAGRESESKQRVAGRESELERAVSPENRNE